MKAKLLLVALGCLPGTILIILYLLFFVPEKAPTFSSVKELHKAMLQRDDRDLQGDRSVSLRSIIAPHPSKKIIYDLIPNLDVKFQGVETKINSCGMRSPEREAVKSPTTYRIALLGDSFAFGWGVEYQESFAHQLEVILNEAGEGKIKVEVLNFGVPGYSTFQEVAKFQELGDDFDIDAALVYFVENDFGLPFFLGGGEGADLMSAPDYAKNVWDKDNEEDREEKKFLRSVLDPNRALIELDDYLKERGIPLFVAVNPGKGWEGSVQRLHVLRRRRSIRSIDMREDMLRMIKEQNRTEAELRLASDPHPSPIKHRMLAEILSKGFVEEVQRRAS